MAAIEAANLFCPLVNVAVVDYMFRRFLEVRPEFRQNQISCASRACNLAWRRMLQDLARGDNYWTRLPECALDILFSCLAVSPQAQFNQIACVSRFNNIRWRRYHRQVMSMLMDGLQHVSGSAARINNNAANVHLHVLDMRDAYN